MAGYRLLHLVTVGTSILRNASRILPEGPGRELAGGCAMVPPGSGEDEECARLADAWGPGHEEILSLVERDPERLSAELNAMIPWIRAGRASRVILYPTDTGPGRLSAAILRRYLARRLRGVEIAVEPVPGFSGEPVWRGGVELYRRVAGELRAWTREEGGVALLNATGGFKPETAYLVLAGTAYGNDRAAALYIHELHRKRTVIPLIYPGAKRLGAARDLLTRALARQRGPRVSLARDELSGSGAEWLHWYAWILEPLGEARAGEDYIELSHDTALYISMLP